ncbi:MAG: hypothetical protein AAF478_12180 [Pseudomonadota bacterium]
MRITTISAASFIFVLSTSNAYAYLDPGTGSILLQGLIGAVASGMFLAKLYWAKLKSIVGFSGSANNDSANIGGDK